MREQLSVQGSAPPGTRSQMPLKQQGAEQRGQRSSRYAYHVIHLDSKGQQSQEGSEGAAKC